MVIFFCFPCPSGRIAIDGSGEEFSSLTEKRGGWPDGKTVDGRKRGGGREGKRRRRHGTVGLRSRKNSKKGERFNNIVSVLSI